MTPKLSEICWSLNTFICCKQYSLKHIGKISEVENVVEFYCCWGKSLRTFCMKEQCSIDYISTHLPHKESELISWIIQIVRQNWVVDREQRLSTWEDNGKSCKMSLKSWIDCKTSSWRIHASHILTIVNVLLCQLVPIIPVAIVHVLSDQCVRSHSSICINLWHVHVIKEVDEFLVWRRSIVLACFLFQRLLKYLLCHFWGVVEIEWDTWNQVVFIHLIKFLTYQQCLSASS